LLLSYTALHNFFFNKACNFLVWNHIYLFLLSFLVIVVLKVHCDIYKSSYNISELNLLHPSFSFIFVFCLFVCLFKKFFSVVLEFELRASCLLGRHSSTWATLPALKKCQNILLAFINCIEGFHCDIYFVMSQCTTNTTITLVRFIPSIILSHLPPI
jgi:hypothetical protein